MIKCKATTKQKLSVIELNAAGMWLIPLHSYGLLRGSFRPENQICVLRSYIRHRESLIQNASMHVQRMQKTLTQMNILLHNGVRSTNYDCYDDRNGFRWESTLVLSALQIVI